jgi:hypothetical protein
MEDTLDTSAILLSIEDTLNILATWTALWTPQLPDFIEYIEDT